MSETKGDAKTGPIDSASLSQTPISSATSTFDKYTPDTNRHFWEELACESDISLLSYLLNMATPDERKLWSSRVQNMQVPMLKALLAPKQELKAEHTRNHPSAYYK